MVIRKLYLLTLLCSIVCLVVLDNLLTFLSPKTLILCSCWCAKTKMWLILISFTPWVHRDETDDVKET
jgi:hypothetical protein